MLIKDWIKENRLKLGLTQKELGDKIHVVRQTISMYETGKRKPDFDSMCRLADVYNVDRNTLNDLLEDIGNTDTDHYQSIESIMLSNNAYKWWILLLLQTVVIICHFVFLKRFNSIDFWRGGIRESFYRFFMTSVVPVLFIVEGTVIGKLLNYYEVRIAYRNAALKKSLIQNGCIFIIALILLSYVGTIDFSFEFYKMTGISNFSKTVFIDNKYLLYVIIIFLFSMKELKAEDE